MTVHLVVNDAVWDASRGLIDVVTAASSPASPDSIVSLDPRTGLVQATHQLQTEPKAIAISADGQYVYAGLANGGGVARVRASGLAADISFAVGSATSTVSKIRVSPNAATTIAVIVDHLDPTDFDHPGVELFDNAVLRPATLRGTIPLSATTQLVVSATDLHWSADGGTIYATMGYVNGIVDLTVAATGVSITQFRLWPVTVAGRLDGTRLFLDDGRVLDLNGPVQQLGRFSDYGNPSLARAELLQNQKAFSSADHFAEASFGPYVDGMTINAFDANTFALIDTITWKSMTTATQGRLLAWGVNGIAWADANGFIIASGTFAERGGGAAAAAAPATVASGSFTGSNGAVNFTVLDFGANDIATDSCNHLYVSTSGASLFRPNSIVAYDVLAGSVAASGFAGSEPNYLAVSDDCSAVYTSFFHSNSVARISSASLAVETVLPLGGDFTGAGAFALGRSIAVAPGARNTVAVAKGYMAGFKCGDGDLGVSIFDDASTRPNSYNPTLGGIKSIAWGSGAATLYGEDAIQDLFALSVDATGVPGAVLLQPSGHPSEADVDIGRDLFFDRATRRIYDSFGHVVDTTAGATAASVSLPVAPATNLCGTPLDGRATDATTGKLFFVEYNGENGPAGVLTLSTFDATTLGLVDTARLLETPNPTDYGYPVRVVRLPPDRIAIATNIGYVVIFQGAMLSP